MPKSDLDFHKEAEYWYRAAVRKDQEGQYATAITFRNLAWLLEHQESWREWIARNCSQDKVN